VTTSTWPSWAADWMPPLPAALEQVARALARLVVAVAQGGA
jgi:hypothetical protein